MMGWNVTGEKFLSSNAQDFIEDVRYLAGDPEISDS